MAEHGTTHDPRISGDPEAAAPHPAGPARRERERSPSGVTPVYYSIEAAAAKLGLTDEALRARCRRARKGTGAGTIAELGAGIFGVKFGRTWRIRFPPDDQR